MGKLAEYLKNEGGAIRAAREKRQAEIQQWTESLEGLYRQLNEWLAASDPEGLLERSVELIPGKDPALGEHHVPSLKISAGDRTVHVVPRVRYAAATVRRPGQVKPERAHGLAEIRDDVGMRQYHLFLLPDGKWYIQSEGQRLTREDNVADPLDAEHFDAAVWNALQ
jgi:hypothetical protein